MMLDKHKDVSDTKLSKKLLEEIKVLAVKIRRKKRVDQRVAIEQMLKAKPELKIILDGYTIVSGKNAYRINNGSIEILPARSKALSIVQGLVP